MQQFRLANNIVGWLIFLIAAFVYITTMEPTASFWDCGEFIAASYKLQVPHPPGAPFFLLVGRLFSMLAGGDVEKVAYWVNMVSALSSAGASMLLFWTITMLARKITGEPDSATEGRSVLVILAGIVGALAYTYCDSAWWSASEAEVYAMSSLFTALVFWAILRWERVADEPGSDNWLLLIAYFTGLSIGVHLLNLTATPALAMLYYFRRHKYSTMGAWGAFIVGLIIIGIIMVGIIPGLPSLANVFELAFVNSFGLPFNSGILFFSAIFVGVLVWLFRYSKRKQNYFLYNGLIALLFVLFGYASYGVIVVRATHKPPINENDPSNAISVVSYLKREQYGERPLLYGPMYNSQANTSKKTGPVYIKGEKQYEIVSYKFENMYPSSEKGLLPRIYSPQGGHVQEYKKWIKGLREDRKPSLAQNLNFMFSYQMGWMYMRYFMWNFAGRESDIQGAYYLKPWDSNADLPPSIAENKARNQFFMIPLIIGLLGVVFHSMRAGRDSFIVLLLFFFTGLAIVIYLNQPPVEPRERDYTFAGSFYAFSIWIGMGVLALDRIFKAIPNAMARAVLSGGLAMVAPVLMAKAGWDDHDRSNRYHSVDSAKNLLAGCAKNAIIFTGGDNDTFPLWYVQEVEGFRTDVRVCNLSLLGTDWYGKQMKQKAYDSEALPISLDYRNFASGVNDYLPFYEVPQLKAGVDIKRFISAVKESNPMLMQRTQSGMDLTVMPTRIFKLDVNKAAVETAVPEEDRPRMVSNITWDIGKGALYKSDLLMLDILANNEWKRPIYFSTTLGNSNFLNLREYMYLEGLAYRLLPVKNEGAVNIPVMYENMMKKMSFRGLDNPDAYFDENYKRFPLNARKSFYMLAQSMINEAKYDTANAAKLRQQAGEVVDHCLKVMPDKALPYDFYMPSYIGLLLELGKRKEADAMASLMAKRADAELRYMSDPKHRGASWEVQTQAYILDQISNAYRNAGVNEKALEYNKMLSTYSNMLEDASQEAAPAEEEQ